MNNALGGLFSSRINLNLREKNGYSYGAGSAFAFRRGPGPYAVIGSVRTDATAPAVKEIFTEIGRMRDEPADRRGADPGKVGSLTLVAGTVRDQRAMSRRSGGAIYIYGLPIDYYMSLPAKIDAVSVGGRPAGSRTVPAAR